MQKGKINLTLRSKKGKEPTRATESAPSRRPSPTKDMVKAPRSKGCRVCVQRRVKCDQTKPHCQRCQKANRQCPGYESIKFVDEGPSLQDMYHVTGNEGPSRATSPSSSSDIKKSQSPPTLRRTISPSKFEALSPITEDNWIQSQFERNAMITMLCPSMYQDQLLANYIDAIKQPVIGPTFRCHSVWLLAMAQRPKQSSALIWAIRAISISFLGKRTQDEKLIQTSRRVYGKALLKLNAALQTDDEGLSSDTLSATVLLSMYEIFNCTDKDSWVKHAGGAGNLIRLRGPNRHRTGFGRTVFVACRYSLMTEAFHTREACFLAEPEWRDLCAYIHATSPNRNPIYDSNEAFFQKVVCLPGYIRQAINLVQSPSPSVSAVRACLSEGISHRSQLHALHAQSDATIRAASSGPVEIASSTLDAQFPMVYSYPDIHVASLYCGFWAIAVGANVTILGLEAKLAKASAHDTAPFTETTSEYAFTPTSPSTAPPPSADPSSYNTPNSSSKAYPQPPQIHLTRLHARKHPRPLWDAALALPKTHPYLTENTYFAHQVCKSVEYMASTAFLGPLFVVFSLRMALRVLDAPAEKRWAVGKLGEIGQTVGLARTEIEFAEREGLTGEEEGGEGKEFEGVLAKGKLKGRGERRGSGDLFMTKGIFGSGGVGFFGQGGALDVAGAGAGGDGRFSEEGGNEADAGLNTLVDPGLENEFDASEAFGLDLDVTAASEDDIPSLEDITTSMEEEAGGRGFTALMDG